MGKRILQLYAEDTDIALAKSKGINLSAEFREWVSLRVNEVYQGKDKDKIIADLKKKMVMILTELKQKTEEVEKLKKGNFRKEGPLKPLPYPI